MPYKEVGTWKLDEHVGMLRDSGRGLLTPSFDGLTLQKVCGFRLTCIAPQCRICHALPAYHISIVINLSRLMFQSMIDTLCPWHAP